MGKQMKMKKPENLGKGRVTPVQVAFIVDQYLVDNNYSQTSTIFRTEASSLISKTQVRQAPKSLLSLGSILDEYICLKEQKVMMDQEKFRLDQEKFRVQTLLQGMKSVMNDYNSSGSISPPTSLSPMDPTNGSSAVHHMNRTPTINSPALPWVSSSIAEPNSFSTPTSNISTNKRKSSKLVSDVPPIAKRTCNQIPTDPSPVTGKKKPFQANDPTRTQPRVHPHCPPPRDSSLAKSLFMNSLQHAPDQTHLAQTHLLNSSFSLAELLVDIDFACNRTEPTSDHSSDFVTGSGHECEDAMLEPNQTLNELSSSVSKVLCEKNMNIESQGSLASVKSITKCIRILSPAKNRRNSSIDQEKLCSKD